MSELHLNFRQYLEMEKIGLGAFHPLDGFMNEDDFHSVVKSMRLCDGQPFSLPIVLDIGVDDAQNILGRPNVDLVFRGELVGTFRPESQFRCERQGVAREVFGTADEAHPGVAMFYSMGEVFVGGAVKLEQGLRSTYSMGELAPAETRDLFRAKGWNTVVGFQTRNVPHRAHEHLQRLALEQADGLFIQPLVGARKAGDFTPEAVLAGYRCLIDGFLPSDRVVLGILSTYMRYAGPREAVFHAIIRRNYGCTHFIVGRDHAGVNGYYGPYAAHELTRRFEGELGIQVLRFFGPRYCARCDGIVTERTCPHQSTDPSAITEVSGTAIRSLLIGGKSPQQHLMRPEVIASLRDVPLFISEAET